MFLSASPADLALYWLSHRGSVTDAVMRKLARKVYPEDATSQPYWRLSRALQLLGHIEWSEDAQRWCTLAPYGLQSSDGETLLCGARLPGWVPVLEQAVGLQLADQYCQRGPQRWVTEEPPETCGNLSVPIFSERGLELLRALPELPVAVARLPQVPPPTSGQWERLIGGGGWQRVDGLVLGSGLYRHSTHTHKDHLLKVDGVFRRARSREEKALCWWYQQGTQPQLKVLYEQKRRLLLLPHIPGGRLPLVAERALCSSSGLLPRPEARRYSAYFNLELEHAEELTRILCCNLEVC